MASPHPRTLLPCILLAWACLHGEARALGLMVLKGANASPEFAKVIVVGRVEKFAVSYKAQVHGQGELVLPYSEVFGLVEYDPEILSRDLVNAEDFAPIEEVIAKTESLAQRYPAMKTAAPTFIKSLQDALGYRNQGLVHIRDRWMRKAEYDQMQADQQRKEEEAKQRAIMAEQTRMAELRLREAEAKAMTAVAETKRLDEERARKEAEQARAAAAMRAEEDHKRQMAETAEKRRQEEKLRETLTRNLEEIGAQPTGRMLKAEWERLAARQRAADAAFQGFRAERSTLASLTGQHFAGKESALPQAFGASITAMSKPAGDGRSLLVLLNGPEDRMACLMSFDLPMDAQGMPAGGKQTQQMLMVLRDVSGNLADDLPRAVGVCLTSLAKSGALSTRAPIGTTGVGGYVALTRAQLEDDGIYHATALVVLGFREDEGDSVP